MARSLLKDPSKPYDPIHEPIKLDDYGLDSEGLAALNDGTFWVSDEYGPHIVHYDANGKKLVVLILCKMMCAIPSLYHKNLVIVVPTVVWKA